MKELRCTLERFNKDHLTDINISKLMIGCSCIRYCDIITLQNHCNDIIFYDCNFILIDCINILIDKLTISNSKFDNVNNITIHSDRINTDLSISNCNLNKNTLIFSDSKFRNINLKNNTNVSEVTVKNCYFKYFNNNNK